MKTIFTTSYPHRACHKVRIKVIVIQSEAHANKRVLRPMDDPLKYFKDLEKTLDTLVKLCVQLRQENRILHSNQQSWNKERTELIEKNELACAKIESMLKTLE